MRVRRLFLVAVALAISAALLHTQISSALLTRGDSLAYLGLREDARRVYKRALMLDPSNGVAADRLVFAGALSGDSAVALDSIALADRYLSNHPSDAAVLMDRAFCYQHLGRFQRAASDFRQAGFIARDPRALMFAASDERRLHGPRTSAVLLAYAVAMDPTFVPALRALREASR